MAAAKVFTEWRAFHSAGTVATKSAGSFAIDRPNRSLSWLTAIISAIPIVKPSITASGMSAISLPARANAAPINITPAIRVASSRPSNPNCSITP